MVKHCMVCEGPFQDGDDIVVVARSKFHLIPSRVHFCIANPTEVYEMEHFECAKGDLIPPGDNEDYGEGTTNDISD